MERDARLRQALDTGDYGWVPHERDITETKTRHEELLDHYVSNPGLNTTQLRSGPYGHFP